MYPGDVYTTMYTGVYTTSPDNTSKTYPRGIYVNYVFTDISASQVHMDQYMKLLDISGVVATLLDNGRVPSSLKIEQLLPVKPQEIERPWPITSYGPKPDGFPLNFCAYFATQHEYEEYAAFVNDLIAVERRRPQPPAPAPTNFVKLGKNHWKINAGCNTTPAFFDQIGKLHPYEDDDDMCPGGCITDRPRTPPSGFAPENPFQDGAADAMFASCMSDGPAPAALLPNKVLHQVNNGTFVEDDPVAMYWHSALGSPLFPNLQITSTLYIFPTKLKLESDDDVVLECALPEGAQPIIDSLLEIKKAFNVEYLFRLFASMEAPRMSLATPPKPAGRDVLPAIPRTEMNAPKVVHVNTPPDTNSITWQTRMKDHTFEESYPVVRSKLMQECFEDTSLELDMKILTCCTAEEFRMFMFMAYLLSYRPSSSPEEEYVIRKLIATIQSSASNDKISSELHSHWKTYHYGKLHTILSSSEYLWLSMAGTNDTEVWLARILLHLLKTGGLQTLTDNPQKWLGILFNYCVYAFAHHAVKRSLGHRTKATDLYEGFQTFVRDSDLAPILQHSSGGQSDFNTILRSLGYEQKRISSGKIWMDLELKPSSKDKQNCSSK